MKKYFKVYLIAAIVIILFSRLGLAEECTKNCQERGDFHYNDCLKSVAKGELPTFYANLTNKKFVPPTEGYETQKYCYVYAKQTTKNCFDKCPDEINLFYGQYRPSYTRDDIKPPKTQEDIEAEKQQEKEDLCDHKCMVWAYDELQDKCLESGKNESECFDASLEAYKKCSEGCKSK
ncbi:MAG: hypothetical protein ACFFG0_03990 [Candidatus Thorarchaeota archaeon]